ncbi:MAG: dienelactone hydrolase family protein [Candidatus Portiera sp.]|nr:dienelactone hydrolase family protein [Portiera sp.]
MSIIGSFRWGLFGDGVVAVRSSHLFLLVSALLSRMTRCHTSFLIVGIGGGSLIISSFLSGTVQASVKTQEVAYYKDAKGYLALPSKRRGKKAAVILIHEWWGINDDIRRKAEDFAEQGYVAFAVDLYGGQSTSDPAEARKLASAVGGNNKEAFANLGAALGYLKQRRDVDDERLASVGWCFGGGWSYQMAKNNLGTKASVIYYGRFNPADDLALMRARIMGHFAEKDRGIKVDNVKQFQATLRGLSAEHEIFIYPNAGHGFANPDNKRVYDKDSAEQAYARTLEFLEKHL